MVEISAGNIPVDHLQSPVAAVEYARRMARRDIPSNFLVRAYHMGQNTMMRICYDEVAQRSLPTALGPAVPNASPRARVPEVSAAASPDCADEHGHGLRVPRRDGFGPPCCRKRHRVHPGTGLSVDQSSRIST
jgi:hypothetical protein